MSDRELHERWFVRPDGTQVVGPWLSGDQDEAIKHVAAELESEPLNTCAYIRHPNGGTTRLTKMIAVEWFAPSPDGDDEDDEWEQGPYQRKEE